MQSKDVLLLFSLILFFRLYFYSTNFRKASEVLYLGQLSNSFPTCFQCNNIAVRLKLFVLAFIGDITKFRPALLAKQGKVPQSIFPKNITKWHE